MSDKSTILNELLSVTGELEQIKNKVNILKELTETRMKNAADEHEKMNIFAELQDEITKIKKDGKLKTRYKDLKSRQENLKSQLTNHENSKNIESIDIVQSKIISDNSEDFPLSEEKDDIAKLISKYQKVSSISLQKNISNVPKIKQQTVETKQKITDTKQKIADAKQIKRLHRLMDSLKMNFDD
jgi:hypothetical protein